MIRRRWFGATGRQVPELAIEGDPEVPLDEALVLDDVGDEERLRAEHAKGTPIVVQARTADEVRSALARPEVASVVVPESERELLELDLTELTYGA
ncbi:MAG: hypothetical protein M3540_02945 [Actinomycetota bacterium]|nr:hypothetical protein [Actinomycetota bacterium]